MNVKTLKFLQGLNQKPDPELTDGLIEAQDVLYERVGSVRAAQANSTGITYGSPVHSMGMEGLSSSEILLSGVGTNLYFAEVPLKTDLSGLKLSFASALNRIYFTNETDGLWNYNWSLPIYRAGAPAPSTALTAGNSGGGSFTGTYSVVVTYRNANGFEGNPSDAASTGSITTQLIDLTSIPVNTDGDYNITSRRVWIRGGTSPLYVDYVLLTTISDNSTTSVSGLDTSDVDTDVVLETDNDLPTTTMTCIFNHYNVLFGLRAQSDDNIVAYSKAAGPEQWPTNQALTISKSGDPVMWGLSWSASAWVVTRKKIFQIIGSPGSGILATNFFPKESGSQYGTIAARSVVGTPYGIIFQAEDGIRLFDGANSKIFSNEIETTMNQRSVGDNEESLSIGAFAGDKYFLSFCLSGSSVPDTTVIYDFKTNRWSTHGQGYRSFASDRRNNQLFVGTGTGIDTFRGAGTYSSWAVRTNDLTAQIGSYGSWAKFQVDMEGTFTGYVYLDDTLSGTYSLSASTRKFITRRFPLGMAQRASLRFAGTAKSTQDKLFSVVYSDETQGGVP